MFCSCGPNLVILAWTRDKLSHGQASAYRTHRHTDRQTQPTTIPEGQNWPRVKNKVRCCYYHWRLSEICNHFDLNFLLNEFDNNFLLTFAKLMTYIFQSIHHHCNVYTNIRTNGNSDNWLSLRWQKYLLFCKKSTVKENIQMFPMHR